MKRFAVLIALGITAWACTSSGGGQTAAPAQRTLRFALIPKALDIPVFGYANIGAQRKAKEIGNVEVI